MNGAVMITERVRLRAGLRHSPAKIATYSKPLSAPNIIFAKTLRLNRVRGGIAIRSGWYSLSIPRQRFHSGVAISTASVIKVAILPALLIHFPRRSPKADINIMARISTKETARISHLLPAIHAAVGPKAYATNVVVTKPITATYNITNSHRFQATKNPT